MSPDTPQPQPGDEMVERMAAAMRATREFAAGAAFGVPADARAAYLTAIARAALAVARPLIAADVQQRIAVALDQHKGDPRYGAALFVQRLDLNLSEAPR